MKKLLMILVFCLIIPCHTYGGLIWNDTTQSHDIRVNGVIITDFKASALNALGTDKEIEDNEKAKKDALLNVKGYQLHIHINDKATKSYIIMLSLEGTTPVKEWWNK